jgi:hypothetical protein
MLRINVMKSIIEIDINEILAKLKQKYKAKLASKICLASFAKKAIYESNKTL